MANTLIYSTVSNGDLLLFGNTLGLSKANNTLTPGNLGSIGTFITMDNTKTAPGGWGANTTLLWQENSSNAIITLDSGDTIVHAFLFWGATYNVTGLNLTSSISTLPVTLVAPSGINYSISPTATKLGTLSNFEGTSSFYTNYADVSTIVTTIGEYICKGVPCAMSATNNLDNCAGWTLAVITSNPKKIWSIISLVHSSDSALSAGFTLPIVTPKTGTPTGYFTTAALDGDVDKGDAIYIGPYLFGPINPIGNFFNSQIQNGKGGSIDTTNLYGTSNNNLATQSNNIGARQGFDIIRIPYPPGLSAGITSVNGDILYTNANPTTLDDMGVVFYGFQFNASNATTTLNKTVSKNFAVSGDILTYTLVSTFIGTGTIASTILFDSIPSDTTFIPNSLIQDGVSKPGVTPNTITYGTITLPYTTTISYKVTINTTALNPISNDYNVIFNNFLSNNQIFTTTITSEKVLTTIPTIPVTCTKETNQVYGTIGTKITYTIILTNKQASPSANIILVDTIPNSATLIPNTVILDGITLSNTTSPLILTIPNLILGNTSTLSYSVIVNTLPNTNSIVNITDIYYNSGTIPYNTTSNIVSTTISYVIPASTKYVNENNATIGNILTYTIVISNTGNTPMNNIVFIDTIPIGTTIIPNSFKQDSLTLTGSPNYPGITLPNNISSNSLSTITYQVLINSVPPTNPIINIANMSYMYTITPSNINGQSSAIFTNTVATNINYVNLSGITKWVDKVYSTTNGILTYIVTIPNSGNIPVTNIFFIDTVPNGTTFINNSFLVNGASIIGANPSLGVSIPDIQPNSFVTISFMVVVN